MSQNDRVDKKAEVGPPRSSKNSSAPTMRRKRIGIRQDINYDTHAPTDLKSALEISIQKWIWRRDHPCADETPLYDAMPILSKYPFGCAVCAFIGLGKYDIDTASHEGCSKCPIGRRYVSDPNVVCCPEVIEYELADNQGDITRAKRAATNMLRRLRRILRCC